MLSRLSITGRILVFLTVLTVYGCASIPQEAPELSAELGNRIHEIQVSNLLLLHHFFECKRSEVDKFIQEEWVPTFAEEIFSDSRMKSAWNIIVAENNPADRLRFLVTTGTRIQQRINQKRTELVAPLDEIERRLEQAIRDEYEQAKAINHTLTSFLLSTSRVAENRTRYLEMAGFTDDKVGTTVDKVNHTVTNLVSMANKAEDKAEKANQYLKKIREIIDSFGSRHEEG